MKEATIKDLAYLIKQAKDENQKQPIVFLGAGASRTGGIPLAGEIVKDILTKYSANPMVQKLAKKNKSYSELMECLTPFERNKLLKKYISEAKINVTHIYLAQLLSKRYVDYVLTVNFDNLMLRALALYNEFPPTYDMAILKDLTTTTFREKSIIYLHGQHHGLWLLNTKEELEKVRSVISPILNSIKDRPWIFIGYSGNDPIFNQIVNLGRFDKGLYWVTYNNNVPDKHVIKKLLSQPNTNAYLIEGYDSDTFMLKLNNALNLPQPEIIDKPFSSLRKLLSNIVDIEDRDQFSKVKQRLVIVKSEVDKAINQFEEYENIAESTNITYDNNHLKKQIINKIVNQNFDEKDINHLEQKVIKTNDPDLNSLLSGLYSDWGISLYKRDKNLYLQCISKYKKALEINPKDDLTLFNWGTILHDRAKQEKDPELYFESIDKYEAALDVNPDLDIAYNNWGTALSELSKLTNNKSLNLKSFEKYQKATELNSNDDSIFYNWGNALQELAKSEKDPNIFSESFQKFEQAIKINPNSPTTYNNWGLALCELATILKDDKVFQLSITKYKEAVELDYNYYVAYNNWGNTLSKFGDLMNDSKLYKKSIAKYKLATDLKKDYFYAYNNWGNALYKLAKLLISTENEPSEAIKLIEKSFEKYKTAIKFDPTNHTFYNNWGGSILELAQLKEDKKLFNESMNKLHKAIDLGGSPYNLSCFYASRGEKDEALSYLKASLKNNYIKSEFVLKDPDWELFYADADFQEIISAN